MWLLGFSRRRALEEKSTIVCKDSTFETLRARGYVQREATHVTAARQQHYSAGGRNKQLTQISDSATC